MSTQTWLRDVKRLLDDMGVRYTYFYTTRHIQFRVSANGRQGIITISASPSDRRSLQQVKTDTRRVLALASSTQTA